MLEEKLNWKEKAKNIGLISAFYGPVVYAFGSGIYESVSGMPMGGNLNEIKGISEMQPHLMVEAGLIAADAVGVGIGASCLNKHKDNPRVGILTSLAAPYLLSLAMVAHIAGYGVGLASRFINQ